MLQDSAAPWHGAWGHTGQNWELLAQELHKVHNKQFAAGKNLQRKFLSMCDYIKEERAKFEVESNKTGREVQEWEPGTHKHEVYSMYSAAENCKCVSLTL